LIGASVGAALGFVAAYALYNSSNSCPLPPDPSLWQRLKSMGWQVAGAVSGTLAGYWLTKYGYADELFLFMRKTLEHTQLNGWASILLQLSFRGSPMLTETSADKAITMIIGSGSDPSAIRRVVPTPHEMLAMPGDDLVCLRQSIDPALIPLFERVVDLALASHLCPADWHGRLHEMWEAVAAGGSAIEDVLCHLARSLVEELRDATTDGDWDVCEIAD